MVSLTPGLQQLNSKRDNLPTDSRTSIWCNQKIRGGDKIISAELPDKDDNPELFETIKTQLIPDPCGVINPDSPCMQDEE